LNTRELATRLGKQPHTLHASYCRNGHYFSLVPLKLPDGTLMWPDDSVDQLLEYARANGVQDKPRKAREVLAAKRATAQADNAGGQS
jgi:hypothetical protein